MRTIKTIGATMMGAVLVAACSASPQPTESSTGESEALCGSGIRPGCGQCNPDPSSPKGGSRTCWLCSGEEYTQYCTYVAPPPTINATWTGHVWTWNSLNHPANADFSVPVTFQKTNGTWHILINALNVSFGSESFASSGLGSGDVSGGVVASMSLPIHGSGVASVDVTMTMSNNYSTISPPDATPVEAYPENGGSFQLVGQGTATDGTQIWGFFSGNIDQWPSN